MQKISRKGRQRIVPSIPLGPNTTITIKGRVIKIGEVFDEFWIRSRDLLNLPEIVENLKCMLGRPDILTSAQKLPNLIPQYSYYYEWDNLAVASFGSYSEWFEKHVNRSARKQIKQAAKEGIRTEVAPFTDDLVDGIYSIYNELPIRQGRRFWHYGKDIETIKAENGTYLERSIFIGAYYENELVGFLKMVMDEDEASLMQILSKSAHFGKRPNNALLSKAVEVCDQKRAKYLTYGQYVYGKQERSGLSEFKKSHGFNKVEIPRYYVPLTFKGKMALKLNLHRGINNILPASAGAAFGRLRANLYKLRGGHN